jgi:hypothetical protein
MTQMFTLIDDGKIVELPAHINAEHVRVAPADLERALGWQLKPEGLCRAGICMPVADAQQLAAPEGIDLAAFAAAIHRPLAIDSEARVGYLGASATERGAQLATLQAPEFRLPDLSGRMHALSDYRGKKVLLVAYASW